MEKEIGNRRWRDDGLELLARHLSIILRRISGGCTVLCMTRCDFTCRRIQRFPPSLPEV